MNKRLVLTMAQILSVPVGAVAVAHSPWWWSLISVAMYYVFGCIGVTVTYHRLLAHRVANVPRWFLIFGSTAGMLGTLLTPVEWVAQHADHHRRTDREGDPHSPRVLGLKAALYAYHGIGKPGIALGRVMTDRSLVWLHRHFWALLAAYIAMCWLALGWRGAAFLWAIPCGMTLWGTIIAVFNHGKNGPLARGWINAVLTCGEQNHIRHHRNPKDWSDDWPAAWVIRAVRMRP